MVPLLFPGVPGGPELLVILLLSGFLLVPLAVIYVAYLFGKRRGRAESGDDDPTEPVE